MSVAMSGHLMDIISTPSGRTQGVRSKALQKKAVLANFEDQMAAYMEAAGLRIREALEAIPNLSQREAAEAADIAAREAGDGDMVRIDNPERLTAL